MKSLPRSYLKHLQHLVAIVVDDLHGELASFWWRTDDVGLVDRAGRRPAGADAGDAPSRGVPRAWHGGVAELQPDADHTRLDAEVGSSAAGGGGHGRLHGHGTGSSSRSSSFMWTTAANSASSSVPQLLLRAGFPPPSTRLNSQT